MFRLNNSIRLSWALVTLASSTIGFPLGYLISDNLIRNRYGANYHSEIPFLFIIITIAGLVIGCGQWTILRTRLEKSWMWIPATAAGLPLGFFIGFWVNNSLPGYLNPALWVMPGVAGMITGMFQLVAIKRYSFLWILVSTLGWGSGFAITAFVLKAFLSDVDSWFIVFPLFGILIGTTVALFTSTFVETILLYLKVHGAVPQKNAS